jgi:glycerate 2-kinase
MGFDHASDAVQQFLLANFQAALAAVDPLNSLVQHLPEKPLSGRVIVLGAGKGAARMARALEAAWPEVAMEGFVVTRYEHGDACKKIEVVEAAHPVPDAAGEAAASRMLALAQSARAGDQVIALISGGGSALLSLAARGINAERKREINKALLKSGAPIGEMNSVRAHLSQVKGGRLGAACGEAALTTLVVSDVPGDDPAVVASGPTIARAFEPEHAFEILQRYKIVLSEEERTAVLSNAPPASKLGPRSVKVIATAHDALAAAAEHARAAGYEVTDLGPYIEGEAREAGRVIAGIARARLDVARTNGKPQLILSGGETTVTVRTATPGRGGRCTEFLLGAMLAAEHIPHCYAIAADTDGIDGSESNAGAWCSSALLHQARKDGHKPEQHLDQHDAYSFFDRLGTLVITGPTRTNVNDYRALVVLPR